MDSISIDGANQIPFNSIEVIRSLFDEIMSEYFKTQNIIHQIYLKITALPLNGSITLGEIISSINSSYRPDNEKRIEMLDKLKDAGFIRYTLQKKNSINITKGPIFSNVTQ